MFNYTFSQWIMFFFIYCFVGWIIESTIVSIDTKKFVNRGFLRGPMLPIYGSGAIVIMFSTLPVIEKPFLVYLFGMLSTTILEYFTGWLMETILKVKYWDYSKNKYNIKGRVCLLSSLFWGVLSLFLMEVLHPFVEFFVLKIDTITLRIIVLIIGVAFVIDTIMAFKAALNFSGILEKLTRIKAEMEALSAQLNERIESSQRVISIKARLNELKEERGKLSEKTGGFSSLIKAHPSAVSKSFNEALKDLQEKIKSKK